MLKFKVNDIFNEVFNDGKVIQSIERNFGQHKIPVAKDDGFDISDVKKFCRSVFYDGREFKGADFTNEQILSSALDSIGSNSRKWSTYIKIRSKVKAGIICPCSRL